MYKIHDMKNIEYIEYKTYKYRMCTIEYIEM